MVISMAYTMAKAIIGAATLLTASTLLLMSIKNKEEITYKITPEYMVLSQPGNLTQLEPIIDIEPGKVDEYLTTVLPEITDNIIISMKKSRDIPQYAISTPNDIASIVKYLENADREYAYIIHLNTKNKLIGVEIIAIGALNKMITQPREVFKGALLNNAAGIIFVHNHPSGDPRPSSDDIDITLKLAE